MLNNTHGSHFCVTTKRDLTTLLKTQYPFLTPSVLYTNKMLAQRNVASAKAVAPTAKPVVARTVARPAVQQRKAAAAGLVSIASAAFAAAPVSSVAAIVCRKNKRRDVLHCVLLPSFLELGEILFMQGF